MKKKVASSTIVEQSRDYKMHTTITKFTIEDLLMAKNQIMWMAKMLYLTWVDLLQNINKQISQAETRHLLHP
jgi:tRNA A37 N6-isopentenylltransferase MiaA